MTIPTNFSHQTGVANPNCTYCNRPLIASSQGTEVNAAVYDSNGHDLNTSCHFRRPETNDATRPSLTDMKLMAPSPKLLQLAQFIEITVPDGDSKTSQAYCTHDHRQSTQGYD